MVCTIRGNGISALFRCCFIFKGTEHWAQFTGWNADLLEKMSVAALERGSEQKNHKNVVELSLEAKLNGRQEQ